MPKRNISPYADHFAPKPTPQNVQADPRQVPNSAGGWGFQVDMWTQARRWLILGSEGGTYYVAEKALTLQNTKAIQACLKADGRRLVDLIAEISDGGFAPKNSPAIFALAMACSPKYADASTQAYALSKLSAVLRTLTHLYEFLGVIKAAQMRGFGRALRTAVSTWLNRWDGSSLAYQAVKYRQRNGWTLKDVLRLAHPVTEEIDKDAVFRWAIGGLDALKGRDIKRVAKKGPYNTAYGARDAMLPEIIQGFEKIQGYTSAGEPSETEAAGLIEAYNLPREAVPTHLLNSAVVWSALLKDMPYTALMRNVATLTRVGLTDEPEQLALMVDRLANEKAIQRSRVHPIAILAALLTYAQGHGMKGQNTWKPHPRIIDALDQAFYMAFQNVESYDGRVLIAIDVSGSMNGTQVAGLDYLSCCKGAAALALPMLAQMPNAWTQAFDTTVKDLALSSRQRLDDAAHRVQDMAHGGTDVACTIEDATAKNKKVDCFVILTDSETWAGNQHVHQAMKDYRAKVNPAARLAIVAMASNSTTVAEPDDALSMNLVGLDTNTPILLDAFMRGKI